MMTERENASPPQPPRAAREQVAQRFDVRLIGADHAMIEPELAKQPHVSVAQSAHLMRGMRANARARGVDHDALAAFEIFERRESHVWQFFVAWVHEQARNHVVSRRGERQRPFVAAREEITEDERDTAASRDMIKRLEPDREI